MQFKAQASISSQILSAVVDFSSLTLYSKQFGIRGAVSDLYFEGTQFEPRLGHRLI
jgi:hypothetical protein